MTTVDFHFDPLCPFAYQTSVWIRDVRAQLGITINWRFFSLEEINLVAGKKHPWERDWSYGWSLMRIGALLRRTNMSLLDRWYAAIGHELHTLGGKPHDPAVARRLLCDVGVNAAILDAALDDPTTHDDVRADHQRVVAAGGYGVPTLFLDLDTHDALCRLTCRDADIQVLSIDYRLAPEHPAPAAVEDAYAAFVWAHEHASDEFGALPGRVAVGGDSAGGNLSAVVCQLARDKARYEGGPTPVLQWLLYPRTDFTAQTRSMGLFGNGFLLTKRDIDWFHTQYLRDSDVDPADPRLSPLLAESLSGLAPALIAVAGFDPLRDEGESYAKALRAAGTAVDLRYLGSLTHGFLNLFQLGGGSAAGTNELISALRAHLSRV